MKNFNLKQKNSVISILKEPPVKKQKKGINWHRVTFLALIFIALFFIGKRIYTGVAEVRGDGQVELEKQAVSFTDDVQLLQILVTEGDTVKRGDTLFVYQNELNENGGHAVMTNYREPVDWILREKLHTKKDIALKNIQLDKLNTQIGFKKEEYAHQKDLVLLGVNHIESTLTSIEIDILKMEAQLKTLKEETRYLRSYYAQLRTQESELQAIEVGLATERGANQFYLAKMDGVIGQINFNDNEVCYERQDVLTLHKKDQISIKGYFDPQDVPYIHRGKLVEVQFPDGSLGEGIIDNFYVSTYEVPKEFQKKYEPIERNVVVDVIPLNDFQTEKWVRFYKMDVKIVTKRTKLKGSKA